MGVTEIIMQGSVQIGLNWNYQLELSTGTELGKDEVLECLSSIGTLQAKNIGTGFMHVLGRLW